MRSLAFIVLLGCASPAAAEVVASSDTGFEIKLAADTPAVRADAWKMLIAPAQWWSGAHTYTGDAANLYISAQATGCFCEKLPRPKDAPDDQRMGSIEHMRIVYADPQRGVLRMVGGLGPLQSEAVQGTLTIVLKPGTGDAGTRIEWDYVVGGYMRMKPPQIAPLVDKVLGEQIAGLAAKLTPVAPTDAPPLP